MSNTLLSVPPRLRDFIRSPGGRRQWHERLKSVSANGVFVGTDPSGRKLGSGGGTLNLLVAAWQSSPTDRKVPLLKWIEKSQRLILHAGGESRRLPAYAAIGKAFLPMPAVGALEPQRFDQMLIDFQVPAYEQVLNEAGSKSAVMVTSGDVWLEFNPLVIPAVTADIAGIGMRVAPEIARHFGVYFVAKDTGRRGGGKGEQPISFFRQKPSPEEIYRQLPHYDFYVDTGMWLLSLEAVRLLFRRCGWDESRSVFNTSDGHPAHLDLYNEIGSALGSETTAPADLRDLGWSQLRSSVIPLDDAHFYHLGSSRQLFESFEQIQHGTLSPQKSLCAATREAAFVRTSALPAWLDGVRGSISLRLEGNNVVTGLPAGVQVGRLAQGCCLEISPVGKTAWVLRPYHLDDPLRGKPTDGALICGRDARAWLKARHFTASEDDVFDLPLYPVLPAAEVSQELLDWYFSSEPDPQISARLARYHRISAARIPHEINFARLFGERRTGYIETLQADFQACLDRADVRVFQQDFGAIADFCRAAAPALKLWLLRHHRQLLAKIAHPEHRSRFFLLLSALSTGRMRQRFADAGYRCLQLAIISSNQLAKAQPRLAIKEDQIVWARSPVRLDLAGGWTDTPPYCLAKGGAVVNLAVLLNGQPPIQVFIRPVPELRFRLRSIDLGSTEDITSYAGLSKYRDPKSSFSLPKAALALAGFHPDYLGRKAYRSLQDQLNAFGGGLEISLLSAAPKGSGLGTSSILGATLLGALNRAGGLGWDEVDLYNRVLGVEQLLTTGGGWQDQAGALFRSIKLIQTQPGPAQTPTVRYLPEHLVGSTYANQTLLLYYTGATRLAKGILKEIVHDMFLGRAVTLRTLGLIRANAIELHHALQGGAPAALHRCIARSWNLNKRLDRGTTTPEIEKIIARCGPDMAACKLLGAGGGGYILLCARDAVAGQQIRASLEANPPNSRARFIDFQVANHALEVTVS
ncbi:MAG: hypothetical protein EXS41_00010 [Opitutaceae bacterium]|nr:hypothetical protein [Opitutaceae bacterium]